MSGDLLRFKTTRQMGGRTVTATLEGVVVAPEAKDSRALISGRVYAIDDVLEGTDVRVVNIERSRVHLAGPTGPGQLLKPSMKEIQGKR